MTIFILTISLILDGILSKYLPFMSMDLSYFTTLLTLTSIFIIYPFYKKQPSKYYQTIIIIGLLYDLFYTNLLFLHSTIFLILGLIINKIYVNFKQNWFKLIIYISILIISYETLISLILILFRLVPVTTTKLIYKITHSLILNILYAELLYLLSKYFIKHKKHHIN